MEKDEKKQIIMDRICRVLTSRKDDASECILGKDAQRIVDCWFKTVNSHFGGKSPEECLDMDYEQVIEYIDYLENQYLHDFDKDQAKQSVDDGIHRAQTSSR